MDIVSFKTANRLKAAGFPQPKENEVCSGNFWYKKDGDVICYGHTCDQWGEPEYFSHSIFAATAADILRELGSDFDLSALETGNWILIHRDHNLQEIGIKHWIHENPAETAALAWIEINEKK